MEDELNNKINKYKILDKLENLSIIKQLVQISNSVIIYGEFEIEPFVKFSQAFQAEYWYLKYCLLKYNKVTLDNDQHLALYEENNINIIWLSVKDDNILIDCKDGDWFITLKKESGNQSIFLENYNLLKIHI